MSWRELERLVRDGETRPTVRRALRGCRDEADLLLRGRRLGYRITRVDLQRAWWEHHQALASGGKAHRASC